MELKDLSCGSFLNLFFLAYKCRYINKLAIIASDKLLFIHASDKSKIVEDSLVAKMAVLIEPDHTCRILVTI